MRAASAELVTLEYDNWNGGTTYYSLVVHVPVAVYAANERNIERIEKTLLSTVEKLQRQETHEFIREVII